MCYTDLATVCAHELNFNKYVQINENTHACNSE